jgi:hypothetical protein
VYIEKNGHPDIRSLDVDKQNKDGIYGLRYFILQQLVLVNEVF